MLFNDYNYSLQHVWHHMMQGYVLSLGIYYQVHHVVKGL